MFPNNCPVTVSVTPHLQSKISTSNTMSAVCLINVWCVLVSTCVGPGLVSCAAVARRQETVRSEVVSSPGVRHSASVSRCASTFLIREQTWHSDSQSPWWCQPPKSLWRKAIVSASLALWKRQSGDITIEESSMCQELVERFSNLQIWPWRLRRMEPIWWFRMPS